MALKKTLAPTATSVDERRTPRDLAGLLTALNDSNPLVRRWAARDLMQYPTATAALVEQLDCEQDPSVSEVILTTLTHLGDDIAVSGLINCLRSENVWLRNQAIEALKQLPNAIAPLMERLLNDPESDVRIFAVNVLESLRHPQVEDWLIKVIALDGHINVCATAVDLLGEVGSIRACTALHELKARFPDEPFIQFATDLALKRIGTGCH